MASPAGVGGLRIPSSCPWAAGRYGNVSSGLSPGRPTAGANVLIVGAGKLGRELAAALERMKKKGLTVVGFVDETDKVERDVLGKVGDLARIARSEFVDEVILAIPHQHELTRWVIREARRNRLDVRLVPDLYGLEGEEIRLEYIGGLPLFTLHEEEGEAPGAFWKRVLDIAGAGAALLMVAPLMAGMALAIKASSPGSVFYGSKRAGLKGRIFTCYKFRTMVTDADRLKDGLRQYNQRCGPCFKLVADPRITRVGRFLRRYSLDELPQLWNVLRGEMSLVGPRPHPMDDCKKYRLEHLRRLDVRPGITGLWQVTARADPSFQRNLALDLEYIERWSLGLDLRILWKTIFAVFAGTGA